MTNTRVLIDLKGVSKIYGESPYQTYALNNINLTINAGEFVAIIGHSGSGKSTLMNIAGCLDKPTSGSYFLSGEEVGRLSDDRLSGIRNNLMGFVFQSFNLLPRTTSLKNVELPLIYSGVSRQERRGKAGEVLNKVGLGEKLESTPAKLSGGQQQRVAIARALINNPEVIFADEPTGNLDTKASYEIMKILKKLNEEGRTVVMITHEKDIAKYAKRKITIKDGRIISDIKTGTTGPSLISEHTQKPARIDILETVMSAVEAIRVNTLRSVLTALGVIIGVLAVILLISITSGIQQYITSQFEKLGTDSIYIMPGKFTVAAAGGRAVNKLTFNIPERIEDAHDPNIKSVLPFLEINVTVGYGNKTYVTTLVGTKPDYFPMSAITVERGRIYTDKEELQGKSVAVIGRSIAREFFEDESPIGKKIQIYKKPFQVVGVLMPQGNVSGLDIDNQVLIPLEAAKRLTGADQIHVILVKATSAEKIDEAKASLNRILSKYLKEDDYSILTQEQLMSTVFQILSILTAALVGIAAISLLVGGIGISNIMLVSVTERTREIGLRKAIGARSRDILSQFLLEAVMVSLTGGIIGVVLGYLGAFLINQYIQTSVPLWSVLLGLGFATAVGVIFGVIPALRAARLQPIEALRHE